MPPIASTICCNRATNNKNQRNRWLKNGQCLFSIWIPAVGSQYFFAINSTGKLPRLSNLPSHVAMFPGHYVELLSRHCTPMAYKIHRTEATMLGYCLEGNCSNCAMQFSLQVHCFQSDSRFPLFERNFAPSNPRWTSRSPNSRHFQNGKFEHVPRNAQ